MDEVISSGVKRRNKVERPVRLYKMKNDLEREVAT